MTLPDYVLTANSASFNNCLAAHERLSYSSDYPITQNWWTITNGNCSRAAELILENHEPTHVPANVTTGSTTISLPGVTPAQVGPWRINSVVCAKTRSRQSRLTSSPRRKPLAEARAWNPRSPRF